ncbi:MAG: arsenosugar biosynthesis radical SAM protein ArsS [Proteobacteria bacterium]|nr:arsenosugar biosynthesis radical SAM protein ArsS [Pseudomonadota bacterium]
MNFTSMLDRHQLQLTPQSIDTLQVNLTKLCNQACRHCHVDSSPKRTEALGDAHFEKVIALLQVPQIKTLDLTGGAPELHPRFRELIERVAGLGKKIMVRHNLTVAFDPHPQTGESMLWLHEFFQKHKVSLVSSLPYYREFLTDRQRGQGVFKKSILGLQTLNHLGYGVAGSGLEINLVYNPVGHYLPPEQSGLEAEYKKELKQNFNIVFNNLFAITNLPVKRFKDDLQRNGQLEDYMEKLINAFNPQAALGVMCRSMLSVSWDGKVYDCDFNQMLEMQARTLDKVAVSLDNFNIESFLNRNILWADHCYGCTAGAGSSCGGTTT